MPDTQRNPQSPANTPSTGDVKDKAKQVVGQAQDAAKPVLDQVKSKADQLSEQAKEQYGKAREETLKGYRQAEGTIARNPAPAMLIGSLLGRREETWSEKYLPESLQNVPDQYDSLVASLKSLPKSVHQQLPRSFSKYLD